MALPDFNFQPIINPYTPLPTRELGSTVSLLKDNYDLTLDNLSKYEQAKGAIQSAPFDVDRELLNETLSNFDKNFNTIKDAEDYENKLTQSKKLLGKFTGEIQPIIQRKKDYDNIINSIISNPNITDKDRAINYVKRLESLQPSLSKTEDGYLVNQFDPSKFSNVFIPEVNVREILDKAISGAKADVKTLPPSIRNLKNREGQTVGNLLQSGSIQSLTPEQIRAIALNAIESDKDIQALKIREQSFSDVGLGNNFENYLNAATDYVANKYGYTAEDLRYSLPQALNQAPSESKAPSGGIVTRSTVSSQVAVPEMYKQSEDLIKYYEQAGDIESANDLREWRQRTDSVALEQLTPDERKIYHEFSELGEQEVGTGGLFQPIDTDQTETINRLKKIGLDKKYKPSDLLNIVEKGRKSIEKNIENITPLARNYNVYRGDATGKNATGVGYINNLLTESADKDNWSIMTNFKKNDNLSFDHVLKNKYQKESVEIDGEDYKFNGSYDVKQSSGIGIDGNPFAEVVIYGDNGETGGDKRTQVIGRELITKGKDSWSDFENLRQTLLNSNNPQDQQDGMLMTYKMHRDSTGKMLGQYLAKKNLASIPKGQARTFKYDNINGKIYKNGINDYSLLINGTPKVRFSDEDQLIQFMFQNYTPE
jgi:hypothetical protein